MRGTPRAWRHHRCACKSERSGNSMGFRYGTYRWSNWRYSYIPDPVEGWVDVICEGGTYTPVVCEMPGGATTEGLAHGRNYAPSLVGQTDRQRARDRQRLGVRRQ